jgi:NADPH:quinone reductase
MPMRSVIVRSPGGPEVLELIDRPVPSPGANEVLIRTRAMGVSRPDILIRKGVYTWMPPLPASPGSELTGVFEAVGEAVDAIRPGQAVLLSARDLPVRGGCYTEYIAVPAEAVHPLPDGVDFDQAVVVPTYLVAYAMLNDLGARPGIRNVFIAGATGGIGGALVELAKGARLEVIGSVGSGERAAHARALGVDHVINYRTDAMVERVMALTGRRGVDIAFDHAIGAKFTDFLHVLADFGTLVFYNIHAPMPEHDVFAELCAVSKKTPAIRCFNIHTYDNNPHRRRELTREVIALLAAGKIKPRVGARLPLTQVAEGHRLLESGSVLGKIVLHP